MLEEKNNQITYTINNSVKCKILVLIDGNALIERSEECPERYVIGVDFNLERKDWGYGIYYVDKYKALEDFTKRALENKRIHTNDSEVEMEM